MSERIIHTVEQGSQEWLDLRAKYHTASNANKLFNNRAALFEPEEVSSYVKNVIFPNGHRIEAIAREYAQKHGISIEPCVMSRGKLLASLDGLKRDFMGNELGVWECKQWNAALAESVKNGIVPETHRWQLVHQLYVTGLKTATFVVTDGTPDKWVECEFTATQADFDKLLAAWDLYEKDLAVYVPAEKIEVIKPVVEIMPALQLPEIVVNGQLEILGDNPLAAVAASKAAAEQWAKDIENHLKLKAGLKSVEIASIAENYTIEQYYEAKSAIEKSEDAEKNADDLSNDLLQRMGIINDIITAIDDAKQVPRQSVRLPGEKVVKAYESGFKANTQRKFELLLSEHKAQYNGVFFQPVLTDWESCFSNLRGDKKFETAQKRCAAHLAELKVAINLQAKNHEANTAALSQFEEYREGWGYDYQNHLTRPPVEFIAEMERRVAALKDKKERERVEALRREIAAIAAYPLSMRGVSDNGLKDKSAELQGFDTAPFGDLENSVKYAIDATVIAINAELTRRAEAEKQAAIDWAKSQLIPVITPKPTLTDNQRAFLCDIAAVVQKHTGADEATAKRRVNSIIDHLLNILE